MSFNETPHTNKERQRQAEQTFTELIGYLGGVSIFNQMRDTAASFPEPRQGIEGVTLSVQPDELGEGIPGLHLDVRRDSVDFSVAQKGPYHLAMEQVVALLPPEEEPQQ